LLSSIVNRQTVITVAGAAPDLHKLPNYQSEVKWLTAPIAYKFICKHCIEKDFQTQSLFRFIFNPSTGRKINYDPKDIGMRIPEEKQVILIKVLPTPSRFIR
jgi:hypothetical protein